MAFLLTVLFAKRQYNAPKHFEMFRGKNYTLPESDRVY